MAGGDVPAQLQIRFMTKQEQFAVPDTPFSVASNITCHNLNILVNELLRETQSEWPGQEFDFLACAEFIRVPLIEHLTERSVSSEASVEVEYVLRHPAPEPQDCLQHDDWVSAVQVAGSWILTGCYDNTLRLWSTRGRHRLTVAAHAAPVKAVSWIDGANGAARFVSVSHDQTAKLWSWDTETDNVECTHVCKGHERGVECVGVSGDSRMMATGGWDSLLKIWTAEEGDEVAAATREGEPSVKRARMDRAVVRTPVATLKGHKEAVTSVVWTAGSQLTTSSWDHTIREWDAETGGIVTDLVGNKAFFDIDWSRLNGTIIAASADRHVRLYDPRSKEGSVVKATFTSHSQWVQSVCWSKVDGNLFISGAYDNQLKLWDTRSPKAPLYDLSGHEDKVLCCDWSDPALMVSGGADNTVRVFKSKHSPRPVEM